MCPESYDAADEVIEACLERGYDYSPHREELARELFDDGIFNGNWDASADFEGLPGLRAIQEDEYDQHMEDDEDKPDEEEQVCYSACACAYIWIVT